MSKATEMPVVFISHGSPMVAIEKDRYTESLRRMAEDLPRPTAIVVVSAHWESPAPLRVGLSASPETIHDFGGFPEELYRLSYPCPGDPRLGDQILSLLSAEGIQGLPDERRGLDHGAWVPLRHAYPAADVPVVELTLPVPRSPSELLRIGRALGPLKKEGVLLIGSGGIVHNLKRVHFGDKAAPVDPWARAFDEWIRMRLESGDVASIVDYQAHAPEAGASVPTSEHFDPIFVVLGAAGKGGQVNDLYEGFHYGNLSMRTFAITGSGSQKR